MYQNAKNLQNFTLEELKAIRKGKIYLPEAFSPPARIVQISPTQAKSSKAKVGKATSSAGHSFTFILPASPPLVMALTFQFDPSIGKLLHFPSPSQRSHQPTVSAFGDPVVPEIPMVSEVTTLRASRAKSPDVVVVSEVPISQLQASGEGLSIIHSSLTSKDGPSPQLKETTPHPSLSLASSSTQGFGKGSGKSPPRLVRKIELS
ncbi:hypothetical protein ACFX1X_022645 [Malus domestica]